MIGPRLLILLTLFAGAWPAQAQVVIPCYMPAAGLNCVRVSAANPLPVTGTVSATTSATAAAALPTLSPGSNSLYESLTGGLYVQPIIDGTILAFGQAAMAASIPVVIASNQSAITVTGTGGTFPVTQSTSPWIVAGGGAAGTAATGVVTVQGIASMTPLLATVSQATASSLNATVVGTGTFATQSAITAASGSFASGSQPIGITPTDRTITSASGSSQQIMAAVATRKSLIIENTGNANCGVNPTGGTASIGGAGTLTLAPLGAYTPPVPTLSAITVICTAGQPIYAEEG